MKYDKVYESPACELIELASSNCILNGSIDSFEQDPTDPWNIAASFDIPNIF